MNRPSARAPDSRLFTIPLLLALAAGAILALSCQKGDKTEEPASPPPSAAPASPTPEEIAWCAQFIPPWGDQVWQEWWEKNPEAGEKWFTETPEKMKNADLSRISRCTHLENMLVAWAPLKDLKPFEKLTRLKRLDIRFAPEVTDLSPLSGLNNLEFLGIWGTSVSDLSPLASLDQLREINARMIPVRDLTPLTRLKKFERIDLLKTPVEDLSPLAQITRVTDIMTCSTQVRDLSPLYPVADRITYLDLCNTPFRAFDELKRFRNLKTLKLWGLPLGVLDPLAALSGLEEIDLSGAEFRSLTPLGTLKQLKKLILIGTRIDAAQLDELRRTRPGLEIVTEAR